MQTQNLVDSKRNLWLIATVAPLLLCPFWLLGGHGIFQTDFFLWKNAGAAILLAACFAAAIDDVSHMKISNWITYPAFLWLVALSIAGAVLPGYRSSITSVGIGEMLLGSLCCFVIVLIPYICGAGGAGDAKMAAVIGAGLGVQYGLIAIGTAFVIAAMLAIGGTVLEKGPVFVLRAFFRRVGSLFTFWVIPPSKEDRLFLKKSLPLGPSFFFGVLFTLTGWIPLLLTRT